MIQDPDFFAVLYFTLGFFFAISLGVVWIMLGRKLNLYLVSLDSPVKDQSLIPITTEHQPRTRRERIEIDLNDLSNRRYSFQFGFDPVLRFNVSWAGGESLTSRLNLNPMIPGKRYWVRDGMKLQFGDREYVIRIMKAQNEFLELSKEVRSDIE